MSELPRLTSAELVNSFGNDQAALRRYRMLVALLREGRPAAEVARTFGVSRESLRRLRLSFDRAGLAALQSRKRGGGHLARGSLLATIIKQELVIEPGVAAAVLWRRVQLHLHEQGIGAPRSTFYRLLAQLRDDDRAAAGGQASIRLLRDALADLAEDPPLALGRGELAALLLPDERDPLGRGRRLRDSLHVAITRLRPTEAGPVLDDARWRHYLIIAGEYETGEERSTLQAALALSASTYSRAKREALERLAALLPDALGELPPAQPPIALAVPPAAPAAIEHEAELEQYMLRLRQSGLALIWGPADASTYDLAAALAAVLQSRGQNVIWHSCRPPDIEANAGLRLLLALAAGLAREGRHDLWSMLTASDATPLAQRLDLLAEGLAGRRWTVIVANTQWLTGSEAARVLDVLRAAQEQRDIRLALVGRQLPVWADAEQWPALPAPNDAADRRSFLARMGDPPSAVVTPFQSAAGALRERVLELVASLPAAQLAALSPEQRAQLLAVLHPIAAIVAELQAER